MILHFFRRIGSFASRPRVSVVVGISLLLLALGVGVTLWNQADSPIVPTQRIDVDEISPEQGVLRRDSQPMIASRYRDDIFRSGTIESKSGSSSGQESGRIPASRGQGPYPNAPEQQPGAAEADQPDLDASEQQPGAADKRSKAEQARDLFGEPYGKGKDVTRGAYGRVKRLTYLYDQGVRLCNLALDKLDPPCEDIVDFDTRLILSDKPERLPGELNRPLFRYLEAGDGRIYALNLQRVYRFNNRAVVVGTLDLTDLTRKSPIVRVSNVASLPGYDGVDLYIGYNVRFYPELNVGIRTRIGNATAPVGYVPWGLGSLRDRPTPSVTVI